MEEQASLNNEVKKPPPKLQIGNASLMAELEMDDESYIEKARTELRETPEVVEQALKDMRLMLQGEPELVVPDNEEYLQKFLRPCKWYPKSAFELMKRYYRFQFNHPRLCVNLTPLNEKNVLTSEIFLPLPHRTKDGCRILLIRAGRKWNPKVVSVDELFKATMLALEAAMSEPKTQIAGVHVILNMEGFSISHVTYFSPTFASMVADWVQRCVPCRLKGIHIVNQPFIFNMVFAIFKPFIQEKTRKRLHFHGTDRAALHAHLGQKPLPTTLGGELIVPESTIGEDVWKYFCYFNEDFEVSNGYGYTKTKKR